MADDHGAGEELSAILVDPETHGPISRASDEQLEALRAAMADGSARRKDGGELPASFQGAYLGQNGRVAYLLIDQIPNFLVEERIELSGTL